MKWYDFFSNYYDLALGKIYDKARTKAAESLQLESGMKILDLACGTGANFKNLKAQETDITIYGFDYSSGMLSKAKKKVKKNNWQNVFLFQADAREINKEFLIEKVDKEINIDAIICSLGFSVIPEWEGVLESIMSMLNKGGRIVIMDVFAEKRNINTPLVELSARADTKRKIWQKLEQVTEEFHMEYIPVNKIIVGGSLFVASGRKH